jgi:hypothetical protein
MPALWLTCDFADALRDLPGDAAEALTAHLFCQLMACEAVTHLKRLADRPAEPGLTRWATGILKLQTAPSQLETILAVLRSHLPLPVSLMIYIEADQAWHRLPLVLSAAPHLTAPPKRPL